MQIDKREATEELENSVLGLCIDFTYPGEGFELKEGGQDLAVTLDNIPEYISLVAEHTLQTGITVQAKAFREVGVASVPR